jgi:hypothetical protein
MYANPSTLAYSIFITVFASQTRFWNRKNIEDCYYYYDYG